MATSTTTTSPTTTTGWCVSRGTGTKSRAEGSAFTIQELYGAFQKCKKNKANKIACMNFEKELEKNLFSLLYDLNNSSYNISQSYVFVVKKPKIREVWASSFRDRVVHHLVVSYLELLYEDKRNSFCFSDNSYSCRKNYGTHKAVKFTKEVIKNYEYFLQLDLKSFFNSLDRQVLFNILKDDLKFQNFKNKKLIFYLIEKIIFHKHTTNFNNKTSDLGLVEEHKSLFVAEKNGKGLPIGNLTSQFFSNVYLNSLDKFIENKNFIYARYVDDFVIFSNNSDELFSLEQEINFFLKDNLNIELNLKKTKKGKTSQGIDFIGYFIKPTHTLIRKRVKQELLLKRNKMMKKDKIDYSRNDLKKMLAVFNSYYGHFNNADSYNFKKKFYESLNGLYILKNGKGVVLKMYLKNSFKNVDEQRNYFLKSYKNSLMAFQIGKFYRFYDEQALFASKKLSLKLIKRKDYCMCGFPLNSKNLDKFKNLGYNYIVVSETKNILSSGIKERIISKKELYVKPFAYTLEDFEKEETLQDITNWDLNNMTPIEVYRRISYMVERDKK